MKLNLIPLLLAVFSVPAFSVDYKVSGDGAILTDSSVGMPFNESRGDIPVYKKMLTGELESELVDSGNPTDLNQAPDVEVEGDQVWLAFRVSSPKVRVVKIKNPAQTEDYQTFAGFEELKGSRVIVGYRAYGEFAIRLGRTYQSSKHAAAVGRSIENDARSLRIRFSELDLQAARGEMALIFTDAEKAAGAKSNTIGFAAKTSTTESGLFSRLYSAGGSFTLGGFGGASQGLPCADLAEYVDKNWAGMFSDERMKTYGDCETLKDGSKQCHALKDLILSEEVF